MWVLRDRIVRLEGLGLGECCEFLLIIVNDMYVKIVGSWANHCDRKIIIPPITEWY